LTRLSSHDGTTLGSTDNGQTGIGDVDADPVTDAGDRGAEQRWRTGDREGAALPLPFVGGGCDLLDVGFGDRLHLDSHDHTWPFPELGVAQLKLGDALPWVKSSVASRRNAVAGATFDR
jgi:hypothetical protein